jgi:hypothetical protein
MDLEETGSGVSRREEMVGGRRPPEGLFPLSVLWFAQLQEELGGWPEA